MNDQVILVLTSDESPEEPAGAKGWGRAPASAGALKATALPAGDLGRRLHDLVSLVGGAVQEASAAAEGFTLQEVQVSVTVTASGQLALMGVGAGASAGATLQLILRRP